MVSMMVLLSRSSLPACRANASRGMNSIKTSIGFISPWNASPSEYKLSCPGAPGISCPDDQPPSLTTQFDPALIRNRYQ